jgi:nucleotide-binding universal stress UspA family protein
MLHPITMGIQTDIQQSDHADATRPPLSIATALPADRSMTLAGFNTVLAVCPGPSGDGSVLAIAEAMARLAGAQLVEIPTASAIRRRADHERAGMVVLGTQGTGGFASVTETARQLLDAGKAVLVVPPLQGRRLRLDHIGIGYDGSRSAEAALQVARALASPGQGHRARLEVAYVDDSARESGESDSDTIAARRGAMIDWWLGGVAGEVPGAVRPVHLIGEPARRLAQQSGNLDLLVIGRRGRPFLRRVFTGSVSTSLIATTRCALLIVPAQCALVARAGNRHHLGGSPT